MLLYFNGDSHTEGAGISDKLIVPGYPEEIAESTMESRLAWLDKRNEFFENNEAQYLRYLEENKKRSFSGQLGRMLNAEIYNSGLGGSSIFSIYARTVSDLYKFSKTSRIPDLFFIGLTTTSRVPIINDPSNDDERRWIDTGLPFWVERLQPAHKEYATHFWKSHSDEDMLTFYLYYCLSIKSAIKSIVNRETIFLNTSNEWYHLVDIFKNTNSHMVRQTWELLNFDDIMDSEHSLEHFGIENGYVACGHFNEQGHIKYAEHIAKKYFNFGS